MSTERCEQPLHYCSCALKSSLKRVAVNLCKNLDSVSATQASLLLEFSPVMTHLQCPCGPCWKPTIYHRRVDLLSRYDFLNGSWLYHGLQLKKCLSVCSILGQISVSCLQHPGTNYIWVKLHTAWCVVMSHSPRALTAASRPLHMLS